MDRLIPTVPGHFPGDLFRDGPFAKTSNDRIPRQHPHRHEDQHDRGQHRQSRLEHSPR